MSIRIFLIKVHLPPWHQHPYRPPSSYPYDAAYGTTTRAYDDDSRLATLTYPDGSVVQQTYTARNQLDHIRHKSSGGSFASVASFTYDPGMRETQRTLGNGLNVTRAYRNDTVNNKRDNLLDSITVAGKSDLSLRMSYDPNKNLLTEDRGTAGSSADNYSFNRTVDAKDRLANWLRDNGDTQDWDLSFEGDWNQTDGNIAASGGAFDQSRTHNAPHEILTIDPDNAGPLAPVAVTHDAKGNVIADQSGRAFVYDIDNKLSSAAVGGNTSTYTYDALNRRVSKTVNGTTTIFVCFGPQVLEEYENATLARQYVYGNYIDEPLAKIESGSTLYYHTNHKFDVVGLTNSTGAIVELYAYTPYGDQLILAPNGTTVRTTSAHNNPYGITGRRYDEETGLWYFRARYFDAKLGRFLSRDPHPNGLYPDGLNTYAAYHILHGGLDPRGLKTVSKELEHGNVEVDVSSQKVRSGKKYSFEPTFTPNDKVCCDKILFVQLTRIYNSKKEVFFGPGEDYLKNRSTADGWSIDQSHGISPYYGMARTRNRTGMHGERPPGVNSSPSRKCKPGKRCDRNDVRGRDAEMSDLAGGYRNKVFQFITYIRCAEGEDKGRQYGVIKWGFATTGSNDIVNPSDPRVVDHFGEWAREYGSVPTIHEPGAGTDAYLSDAGDAWNKQARQENPRDRANPQQETFE